MRSCPGLSAVRAAAWQVYACPLEGGSRAVVLFNRHTATDPKFSMHNMTVFWKSIGLPPTERVRETPPLACAPPAYQRVADVPAPRRPWCETCC